MAFVGSLSGSGGASNTINVTGSIIIANPGTGGLFPAFPGTDAVFFVSGAIGGKAAGSRTVSVFGGDTAVSGSLTIGTGSIRIDSNEIRFQGGAAKITSGSGGLTFFDSGTPSGVTLTTLAAGAGGGDVDGPSDSIDNSIARFDGTTGKLLTGSAITISDETGGGIAIAGSATATTISLFNTTATTVNFAGAATTLDVGNSAGVVSVAGALRAGGGYGDTGVTLSGAGNVRANGFLQVDGDSYLTGSITLAGNSQTVTHTGTGNLTISSTAGSVVVEGTTFTGNNVTIPGDLTVQGTTTTIDTTNLLVEDPIIYFGSGSVGVNRNGGIALASGSSVTHQALVWGRVADDTWGAGRLDVTNGTVTDLTGMSLLPVRASKFELGGATAFVTSSDGTNISITHGSTSTTTFTKAGTPIVQIGTYDTSSEGQIKGVTTANALAPLWLSGSSINVGATSVSFRVNDSEQATISPQTGGGGVRFEAQTGGAPRAMVISGSQTTIGANNRLVVFEGSGTTFLSASVNAGLNTVTVIGSPAMTNASVFNANSTTVNFAGAATTLAVGNTAGTNTISGQTKFPQGLSGSLTKLTDGTSYLIAGTNVTIATGSNGAVTISSTATTTNAAGSDTQVQFNDGGTAFGADADFTFTKGTNTLAVPNASVTAVTASSVIAGGATVALFNTTATTVNFAQAATTITAGASGGSTTFQGNLTGSNILANAGLTVTQGASFGGGAATINAAGNISTSGTLLVVGTTTLSGSVILGDASGDNITFNGRAASDLVPNATNSFDLGTPDLRWRNMYTGDLHLKNERGDWTVIEEEDFLTLTNNKSGKRYKFVLEEI